MLASALSLALLAKFVSAHMAPFHPGMFCLNGTGSGDNPNTNDAVQPMYQLAKDQWWLHHSNGCDEFPPDDGVFLELPAGGNFTVEIADNRAHTTLSYDGENTSEWPDGQEHDFSNNTECIGSPNIHTKSEEMAAGTAFAISYTSGLSEVTEETLVVFTTLDHTPWRRIATYQVPAELPACPDGGCICAWGWVPNGCGEPNIYMLPYRCNVTNATGTKPVGKAQPHVWCEDDESKCVSGPKQLIYWHQQDGNNIEVAGQDLLGAPKSPAYNMKLGFKDGAQDDIFIDA